MPVLPSQVPTTNRANSWPLQWAMATGGLFAMVCVVAVSCVQAETAGARLTRNTIWLSLAWYAASLMFMVQMQPSDWSIKTDRGKLVRWCWTWGLMSFLMHFAVAFHFYHHWSHEHAFEHTRKVSGTGEGIYVSYLFTLLWIADAVWWWWCPERYAARSVWTDRTLHAFMLFIVFNGTIVFASGANRWAAGILFFSLSAAWLATRCGKGGRTVKALFKKVLT